MYTLTLLALVQSLTEFLPVSSSGHLLFLQLLGVSEQGLAVDVALHVGTLLAVVLYFRRDIIEMLCFKNIVLMGQLFVATIPVVLIGLVIHFFHLSLPRNAWVVGIGSIFFGWLLWRVDDVRVCHRKIGQMTCKDALCIGLAQVLSLIPGTSRSGITITCARWLGFKREDSARFSMLLSIPTITLAGLYVLLQVYTGNAALPNHFDLAMACGFAAIFGLCAIAFLMQWVQKASFFVFALYRIIFGLIVLGLVL